LLESSLTIPELQAYERGLFTKSLHELLEGDEQFLQTRPNVAKQPVFVLLNPSGRYSDTGMKERLLNPKLQAMCLLVGLTKRNTIYSLRRTALSQMKVHYGSESARELAAHVPNGHTLSAYVQQTYAQQDITSVRLQLTGLSRDKISAMFAQARVARVDTNAASAKLVDVLKAKVDTAAQEDPQWQALDRELKVRLSYSTIQHFAD
jgi:hypothetical protein